MERDADSKLTAAGGSAAHGYGRTLGCWELINKRGRLWRCGTESSPSQAQDAQTLRDAQRKAQDESAKPRKEHDTLGGDTVARLREEIVRLKKRNAALYEELAEMSNIAFTFTQ